jgi:SAM-dependent methyltransferase
MAYAYDEIAYPGYAFPQTHPDRLATNARLFGLEAAAVERCRVLEIGCGDGGNLVPMAYGLPGSEFVGIDLAARPIAAAQAAAVAIGLENTVFRQLDLTRLPDDVGEFDYIVAHGIYSWVPAEVRDALLAACARHLAPNGVAFVSYNTFPGGHVRRMVRELLLYHVHRAPDSRTRIGQSLAFLKFLADSTSADDEYSALLRSELDRAKRYDPGYLFHDDLADVNEPVYFHEFAEHAARHGLQFLAEAEYFSMDLRQFPPATREALAPLADTVLAREQYLDFLKCRRFRQTLLCREGIPLERPASPSRLQRLLFASSAKPASGEPDLSEGVEEEFKGARSSSMRTASALGKAAMLVLADAWPRRFAFEVLRAQALARLRASGQDPDPAPLASFLLEAYGLGVLEAHAHCPAFAATPGERPRASAIARRQAATGRVVASLLHMTVKLEDEAARALLCALDGSRTREALAAELARSDPTGATTVEVIEQNLGVLARLGLLEA